jgi:hypothetical protein
MKKAELGKVGVSELPRPVGRQDGRRHTSWKFTGSNRPRLAQKAQNISGCL